MPKLNKVIIRTINEKVKSMYAGDFGIYTINNTRIFEFFIVYNKICDTSFSMRFIKLGKNTLNTYLIQEKVLSIR